MRRLTVVVVAVLLAGLLAVPASAHHRPGHGKGGGGETATTRPFAGCSNTVDAANAFNARPESFDFTGGASGYTVKRLSQGLKAKVTKGWSSARGEYVWVQFCNAPSREGTNQASYNSAAVTVMNLVADKKPGATIYVSPLNRYTQPGMCSLSSGNLGADIADAQIDHLMAFPSLTTAVVQRGPILSALSPATSSDGCHANSAGRSIWGGELAAFFG